MQGNALPTSYQWTFTTGSLNLPAPPVTSPLPPIRGAVIIPLDPVSVRVDPKVQTTNNDLNQVITFTFPAPIDPNSFNPDDLIASIEPVVGDPSVQVPAGLQVVPHIAGNVLTITITGWPSNS